MTSKAEAELALLLLKQNDLSKSIVFSPLSIAFALSIVHAGAKNRTRDELRDLLFRGGSDSELISHYKKLSKSLQNAKNDTVISIANKIYLRYTSLSKLTLRRRRENFVPRQEYLDEIKENYSSSAQSLDFSDAKKAAQKMNDFVKKSTMEKITEIVKPSELTPDTVAIIINAMYFKGLWEHRFTKGSVEGDFFGKENVIKRVSYMTDKGSRFYTEDERVQVLSLTYQDSDYCFSIFLPKEWSDFDDFIKELSAEHLQKYLTQVKKTSVKIKIPKMKIETDIPLSKRLQELGAKTMFSDDADFSNITELAIKVDNVVHKAIIEVDERGTIAAAVTKVEMSRKRRINEPELQFVADHPFLYTLSYKIHPLFMGIFM